MSIPLDHLYSFIEQMAEQIRGDVVDLYRFYPHGSKNIDDLSYIKLLSGYQRCTSPMIFCNDQEPLQYDLYKDVEPSCIPDWKKQLVRKYNLEKHNFQWQRSNIYDKSILIHSEQRSSNLEKYRSNQFIPVYYWSHAVISLDWFRYAQHVQRQQSAQVKKKFLIYNRAWSGTREYRLKFAEFLVRLQLIDQCQTSMSPVDPDLAVHYQQHKFINAEWSPDQNIDEYFQVNTVPSHYSANFDIADYDSTDIEIVLETLFDDQRLQLTEKSLRPIACGQPFVLAGPYGSLEYLKKYGFETFADVWDESYDIIQDSYQRLFAIANLMKNIDSWDLETRSTKMSRAKAIAEHNRRHFFSQEFFNMVVGELWDNLKSGLEELERTNTSKIWLERRKKMWLLPEFQATWYNYENSYWPDRTRQDIQKLVARARFYYNRSQSSTGSTDI